jgi:ubiquinone/menaquinone biosynthesis C-methylase UbiE
MTPEEIQTRETQRFVSRNLTSANLRILEVGCGNGALSKQLQDLGHEIVAIDSSAEAIAATRLRGVDGRVACFPEFDEERFDAVLFTRSLHHIRPLRLALERTQALLKPGGMLLVEDFAFADINVATSMWFYRLLQLLDSCGVLLPAEDTFGRKLLDQGGGFSLWLDHVREINSAKQVEDAISERFITRQLGAAPYFYRYVSAMVTNDDRGGEIISRVLELEQQTGSTISQFLIGRRFVAAASTAS